MKKKLLLLSLLALGMNASAQYTYNTEKGTEKNVALASFEKYQSVLWNFDWAFKLGNVEGAERADFDDADWRKLDLPHDFQFEQPWKEEAGGARGFKDMCEGWYRKTFDADAVWQGKKVVVDFEGVMYVSDVYINGKKVASNEYGYTGFEADISKYLNYDKPNVLAVYASTGPKNGSRWYTGGGIFRDVHLKVQNPTHIARHGLYVSTPSVSKDEAKVQVQVEVDRWQKHNDVHIMATVRSPKGEVIASASANMPDHTIQNCTEVKLPLIDIKNPDLWSPDSPSLYTVEVELHADGEVVDRQSDTFGVRWIEFGTDYGFKLNGEKIFLKGIANHHDMGALGIAVYDRAIERQFLTLKQFGFNAVRCSHNPYSDSFARIADKVGIIIIDELIDKWSNEKNEYWGGRKPFTTVWHQLLPEWIKRDRNRPSIVLWSLGNELQSVENWSGFDTKDWGVTTYRIFREMVKRYDDTRLTTVAMFPARAGGQRNTKDFWEYLVPPELSCVTDVASFNYQWKAYKGYYEHKPDLILFQSEATTNELLQPFYGMDRQRGVGLAYWGAIEYWGESNGWPKKGWNYSFFSHTLEPFPQASLIQSAFEPEKNILEIGVVDGKGESIEWNDIKVGQQSISRNWNHEKGSRQNVFTYTNADEVELIYNGKSLGIQKNDTADIKKRNMIYWSDIDYGEGGTLRAIAMKDGKPVCSQDIATTGKAICLEVVEESPVPLQAKGKAKPYEWKADGMDLKYLKIYALDAKGKRVPNATDDITVEVEGEGSFVALDNGDHYTDELFYNVKSKQMQKGYMQCIIRSTRKAGACTVKVSSKTLKGTIIKLKSE